MNNVNNQNSLKGNIIFITCYESLHGGLAASQLVQPAQKAFDDKAKFVSFLLPNKGASATTSVKGLSVFRCLIFPAKYCFGGLLLNLNYAWLAFLGFLLGAIVRCPDGTIFVARSYYAGVICYWQNKIYGRRFIFDPRSLFVLEHIGAKNIVENSASHLRWCSIEKSISMAASRIICVSVGMQNYFQLKYKVPPEKTELVPCFASVEQKSIAEQQSLRRKFREKMKFSNEDIVVVYYGSLDNGWNNISHYKKLFERLISFGGKVVIISQDVNKDTVKDLALRDRIVCYTDFEGMLDKRDFFAAADFGVISMEKAPDWDTRLGVKFADYTCAGLPVLVGEYVGEASRLVQLYLGSPSQVLGQGDITLVQATWAQRNRTMDWAKKYFSPNNIKKYVA